MEPESEHDWLGMLGHQVEISKDGRTIRTGRIEMVAPNGEVLWIGSDGVEPRTLFAKSEGYAVHSLDHS